MDVKWYGKFRETWLTGISPEGWLRRYLEGQAAGLTGNIEQAGYPFDSCAWRGRIRPKPPLHPEFQGWWPYEQTAYAIDGMVRCGRLLGDAELIAKAARQIRHVLTHADRDGYLGPRHIKTGEGENRWVHAVFFRAMMGEYLATGDDRIPAAIAKHYLSGRSRHSTRREICNVEAICWAYSLTGDRRLIDHAVEAYERFNRETDWATSVKNLRSARRSELHGVTFNETVKLPAILYMYTGEKGLLRAAVNGFRKLDRDSMLIDGVPSSTEQLRGNSEVDGHETCDIADYTWSAGAMLLATGQAEWGDRIERACLNAAPGAIRGDFRAIQYFSYPNQALATTNSDRFYGGKHAAFKPSHEPCCCTGNFNRIMPNYAARMWMDDGEGGLAAVLYAPSRLAAKVGRSGQAIEIVEETDYPFSERVEFQVRTEGAVTFTLRLRIPGWCEDAAVLVNGQSAKGKARAGTMFRLRRRFEHNDRVTLLLPMRLKLHHAGGGVAIERGPLVYSLKIAEDWQVDRDDKRSSKEYPAWNLKPASPWNYALAIDEKRLADQVEIVCRPPVGHPWTPEAAPVELHVPARRVKGWKLLRTRTLYGGKRKCEGYCLLTPPLPDEKGLRGRLGKVETVTLVPYGCTHLRMTIFPQVR